MPNFRMNLLFFLCVIGLAASTAHYELLEKWNLWKEQHGKKYACDRDDLEKHMVWLSNKKYIDAHNANAHIFGFTLAMNQFGDMTDAEFHEKYLTYQRKEGNYTKSKNIHEEDPSTDNYPESVDWRTKRAVSAVQNQGQCGASYAFSAMGALEGAHALANGKLTNLSVQNIIDCTVPYGNHGCQGGNMYNTFWYVIANEGVDTSEYYPFESKQRSCKFSRQYIGASMTGTVSIKSGSEQALQSAITYVGPVSVAADASSTAFRYYAGGVFESIRCSNSSMNHAMLVTGYGNQGKSKEYWLVKNSWGTSWGMNGYILMSRNRNNQCGIATDASYPTL